MTYRGEVRWRNGIAEAGCVVAAVAVGMSFVPVVGAVAWLLGPVGLVLSFTGLCDALCHRLVGLVTALMGMVLGFVALVVCVAWVAMH